MGVGLGGGGWGLGGWGSGAGMARSVPAFLASAVVVQIIASDMPGDARRVALTEETLRRPRSRGVGAGKGQPTMAIRVGGRPEGPLLKCNSQSHYPILAPPAEGGGGKL